MLAWPEPTDVAALPDAEVPAALAAMAACQSAPVVKLGKQAFYAQAQMPLAEAYDYCSRVMVENLLFHEAEEGISAFIEKRPPRWQDR